MPPDPRVFISAVSSELRTARDHVAKTLEGVGIQAIWQDIFGAPGGDLREVLKRKIDGCNGLIQLVGRCYGYEPPSFDHPLYPESYTQFEARHAIAQKRTVWFLILESTFPREIAEAEDEDKRALQQAWRVRVRRCGHVYYTVSDVVFAENQALRIAHQCHQEFGLLGQGKNSYLERLERIEKALEKRASDRRDNKGDSIAAQATAIPEKKLALTPSDESKTTPRIPGCIFVSYAAPDVDVAAFVVQQLQAAELPVWFDREQLQPGDRWEELTRDAVQNQCGLFLSLVSNFSAQRSEGFMFFERNLAAKRSKILGEESVFYIPVRIDDGEPLIPENEPAGTQRLYGVRCLGGRLDDGVIERLRELRRAYCIRNGLPADS